MHYTSGTTGTPEGREAGPGRHGPRRPRRRCTRCSSSLFGVQPGDGNVHITGSPLYHTAVLLWTANSLHMGHKVVLMDKWDRRGHAAS